MLRKKYLLLVLLFLNPILCYAQKEAANWVFGGYGGVNFSCASPNLFFTPFDGLEGSSCISSPDGEFLFITNGDVVWSRDFQVMPNGRGIGGLCRNFADYSSASQSALIVPHPGISHQYYVFTADCAEDGFQDGFRYSIIDLSLNGGLGDVIEKNKLLVGMTGEKIAATFQPNGKDVWVVTHGILSNTFYSFSITASGLNTTPVVSNTGQVHPGGRGYLKFSPDGNRMIAACFIQSFDDGIFPELFTFNANTGVVNSDFILTTSTKSVYSASFSPNGKVVYTTCSWTCGADITFIEQFNLEAGSPEEIADQRYNIQIQGFPGALQLGIDGKLYFLSGVSEPSIASYLSVITFPNAIGPSCEAIQRYVELPCWMGPSVGFPNFIESYFQSPVTDFSACQPPTKDFIDNFDFAVNVNCGNKSIALDNQSTLLPFEVVTRGGFLPLTWTFDFGDGTEFRSANPEDVVHTYQQPGTYRVTLRVTLLGCDVRSTQKVIQILPVVAQFEFEQDCKTLEVEFNNLTRNLGQAIDWRWDFGDGSLPTTEQSPAHTYLTSGIYSVTLEAKSICNTSTSVIQVEVKNPLTVSLGADTDFCFGESISIGQPISGASYAWNNQLTTSTISVNTPGAYSVVVGLKNCTATDTIRLSYRDCVLCQDFIEYEQKLKIGKDTTLCETDAIRLSIDPTIRWEIAWSTGSIARSIEVTSPGTYQATITGGNCQISDEVNINFKDCTKCDAVIPNVFTPNDDQVNEEFTFTIPCDYTEFKMDIYNRWGQLVLSTTSNFWNGIIGNARATPGVYYYTIQYSFTGPRFSKITRHQKGWVQLIR